MKLIIVTKPVVVLAPLVLMTSRIVVAGPEEIARFQSDYPAAAERLIAKYARAKGYARIKYQLGGRSPERSWGTFAVDDGFGKFDMTKTARNGTEAETVVCRGPKDGFTIGRDKGSQDYVIAGVGGDPGDRQGQFYIDVFGNYYMAPYAIHGRPLLELMKLDSFHVLYADPVDCDGRECLKVGFQYSQNNQVSSPRSVTLDPALGWAIRGYEITVNPNGSIVETVEYDTSGPMPTPRVVTRTDPINVYRCEFDEFVFEPTPREEFSLAYYGLPDVNRPVGRTPLEWFLIAATAVVVAVLAVMSLLRMLRRTQATA